jgi:hypothetical protein
MPTIPDALQLLSHARNASFIPDPATYTTRATDSHDPYYGIHPDWQPRRLWGEALQNASPQLRNDLLASTQLILHIARSFLVFQISLQLLFTFAQTLGVHYRHGEDSIGLFPRYWANLT